MDAPEGLIERCRAAAARVWPLYDDGHLLETRVGEAGLWMLVGLPSAGKSSFAAVIRSAGREVVEVDEIRRRHGWEIGDPGWQDDAYRIAYGRLESTLEAGVAFESTGLWEPARRRCVGMAQARDLPVRALVVASDPAVCAAREAERRPGNPFFAQVLDAYARTIEVLPREGYTSLHWLDEAERERVAAVWRGIG